MRPGLLLQVLLALIALAGMLWSPSIMTQPPEARVSPEADLLLALVLAPILWPLAAWAGIQSYWLLRRLQAGASYGHAIFTEAELDHIRLAEDRLLATFPTRRNM